MLRVLLIAGGWSNEREVSLSGARQIHAALEELGHQVTFFDPALEFSKLMAAAAEHDFAFINLHGSPGEDGLIQNLLQQAGCPYQGAGPSQSFLALNKAASKAVFERFSLPTPPWELITLPPGKAPELPFDLPAFVKPNMGGSSLGMSLVKREADLLPALDKVFALGEAALVERHIPGTEVTCGVLDQTPLPVIMILPKSDAEFFDYENKYAENGAEEICPAPIDPVTTERVQDLALDAHNALGLCGYSRADFILDGKGEPWLLEVNTLPGMTPTSLVPKAAAKAGYAFPDLIAELIRLGQEEQHRRERRGA